MTRREFMKEYRHVVDEVIRKECPNCQRFNDEERWAWVFNHEGLWNFARSRGVNL